LVHGLSGDPTETWTWLASGPGLRNILWPQEFLPSYRGLDNSSIRVLSFGYTAIPQPVPYGTSTDNDINAYSDNLLEDLLPERRDIDNASLSKTILWYSKNDNCSIAKSPYHFRWPRSWGTLDQRCLSINPLFD